MDSPSLYRDTLKKGWQISKNNALLWVLGFFAALLGNGGEFEFIVTQFNKFSDGTVQFGDSVITMLGTGGSSVLTLMVGLLGGSQDNYILFGLFSVVLIAIIFIVISSQGALIRAIASAGAGTRINLKDHFSAGSNSFFSLLSIILGTRILAFFVLAVVGVPVVAILFYFFEPVKSLFLVLFALGIPLMIIASLISKYAIAYHMLEGKKWKKSIADSLQLFYDHWLVSVELAVILFFINIVAGALIIILILVFAVPFILLSYFIEASITSPVFLFVGQALSFLLLVALGSVLATFQYSCWTELFLKIRKGKHLSKIMRTVVHLHGKYR